jgi:glyoxylase-like metal-dependent hydrolase (beta-lactamase superfamily II)
MKLFLFQCGTIRTKKHLLVEGAESNRETEVPVPFYLIMHPAGNLLFDTGQPLAAVEQMSTGNYIPVMTRADYIANQLKRAGLETTGITHIVLSHLHSDHAGGLEAFSNVLCFIRTSELQCPGSNIIGGRDDLQLNCLDGDYDVFGDGLVRIIATPGHSPGHQSLLLKLDNTGEVFLASDSVYLDELLDLNKMPGVFYDREATIQTINMIREMRQRGVKIISGHDPQAWSDLRKFPDYYD